MNVTYETAHSAVYGMNIIHPYGHLGELPSSKNAQQTANAVPFGYRIQDGLDPWRTVKRIKTYTEQITEDTTIKEIWNAVDIANQIVFLGFGFLPQNMDILTPPTPTRVSHFKSVYATGHDIPQQQISGIKRRIGKMIYGTPTPSSAWEDFVHIESGATCSALFDLHGRNFANY